MMNRSPETPRNVPCINRNIFLRVRRVRPYLNLVVGHLRNQHGRNAVVRSRCIVRIGVQIRTC